MGVPIFKLVFDRQKRASLTKEGAIELRITYNRVQRFVTTGVRIYPNQWKDGVIIKRLDALELQRTLDLFVAEARKVVNGLVERGELDMRTIASVISGRQKRSSVENVSERRLLIDYFNERAVVRKYGRSADSQETLQPFSALV